MNTNTLIHTIDVFDPSKSGHIKHVIGLHQKNEDIFRYIALTYFNSVSDYKKIWFNDEITVDEILGKIRNPDGTYKKEDDFCIRMTDDTPGDNKDIKFNVEAKGIPSPPAHPMSNYYRLALFISIMEYYKGPIPTGEIKPGGKIIGPIEFSWGKRIDIDGETLITIIFRFRTADGMQFYDYSSEFPE